MTTTDERLAELQAMEQNLLSPTARVAIAVAADLLRERCEVAQAALSAETERDAARASALPAPSAAHVQPYEGPTLDKLAAETQRLRNLPAPSATGVPILDEFTDAIGAYSGRAFEAFAERELNRASAANVHCAEMAWNAAQAVARRWLAALLRDQPPPSATPPPAGAPPDAAGEARAGWRPIASAPRDGTKVLLWRDGWDFAPVGHWHIEDGDDCVFGGWGLEEGVYVPGAVAEGFVGWNEDIEDGNMPTHWLPLAAAPAQGEAMTRSTLAGRSEAR